MRLDYSLDHVNPLENYLKEINHTPLLEAGREKDLGLSVQGGDVEARDHLIRANLRLVVRIARRFLHRGLCLTDLIQEGNLGLIHAAEKFDPGMGVRFSTYASYWIKQSMRRALDSLTTPVRLPAYAVQLLRNWEKKSYELWDKHGREPSREEIARALKLTRRQLRIVDKALKVYRTRGQTPAGEEGPAWGEDLADPRGAAPDHRLAETEELQKVLGLLETLKEDEARVLRWHYGLGGKPSMTLSQIGKRLNLTRQRVNQIEQSGLRALQQLLAQ